MFQVIFFGGYLSTQQDIDSWIHSAVQQEPTIKFRGWPFPKGVGAGDVLPVKAYRNLILSLAKEVVTTPDDFIIVGHSSGCAIANEVAAISLSSTTKQNTRLVVLDGFTPNAHIRKQMKFTCWSAKCGVHHSRNWNAMRLTENFKFIESPNCQISPWCLHFSLVNKNATENTVKRITQGYNNCKANLMWLKEV